MGSKSRARQHKRPGQYIRKWADWFDSPAYRSLNCTARCLLEEFQILYRPDRTGIVLPVARAASRLGVCENTVRQAFADLRERGFIALVEDASYIAGRARTYRLTIEPLDGREPTDEWRDWQEGNETSGAKSG